MLYTDYNVRAVTALKKADIEKGDLTLNKPILTQQRHVEGICYNLKIRMYVPLPLLMFMVDILIVKGSNLCSRTRGILSLFHAFSFLALHLHYCSRLKKIQVCYAISS